MLKTTRESEVLTLRVFEINKNKVVGSAGNGSGADETDKKLAKSKKISKNCQKPNSRYLKQPIFINSEASIVFFIKDISDRYFLATVEAQFERLIVTTTIVGS